MAFSLVDFLLNNSGAIGSRIMGQSQIVERDRILAGKSNLKPTNKNKPDADTRRKQAEQEFNDVKADADTGYEPTRTKLYHDNGVIVFDVVTNFDPKFTSKVTTFPVEDKAEISDHIINENPKFSVSAIISDYSGNMNPEKGSMTENDAYKELLSIRDNQSPVSLLTVRDTYTDLILTELGFPKATGDGLSLKIELSFEKIRRVSSELTTVFVKSTGGSKAKDKDGKDVKPQTGDAAKKTEGTKEGGAKPAVNKGTLEVLNDGTTVPTKNQKAATGLGG